jgi:hypothetical protein
MNQSERRQLRIGYILITLTFISPFVVMLAAEKLLGISLPWWAVIILVIGVTPLFIEIMKRYESQPRERESWQNTSKREIILYLAPYVGGSGLIVLAQNEKATDPGLSTLFALLGAALIGVGIYMRFRNQRNATK